MTAKSTIPRSASKILKNLNPVQQEAVLQTENPILILAGAGSGKTRVLTHKIAYLIDIKKVEPWTILAMTFTNKAAEEMKCRIRELTRRASDSIWMGTFHSIFARILRRECQYVGYDSNFSIYDTDDQRQVIKLIMNELDPVVVKNFTPRAVQSRISHLKNKMMAPGDLRGDIQDSFQQLVGEVYMRYQARLKELNAMDFDDLLLKPIELFNNEPAVLARYQERFKYILVDEYQDTNRAQYIIVKKLSGQNRNICVVGDDDQSIYHWRGAEIQNILDFEKDFKDCQVFRLEQNYRSTKNILAAASCVVQRNSNRLEKTLWTEKGDGEKVTLITSQSAYYEALRIVDKIQQEFRAHKRNFRDFAILYRTNAQSRILEDGLRNNAIAYNIVGGTRFYERKEVKDVLAYLRSVVNPLDTISLKRIINYPPRGIGAATIKKIDQFAISNRISFFDALGKIKSIEGLTETRQAIIFNFYKMIEKYQGLQDKISVSELARTLVEELGILQLFKTENTVEAMSRYDNVQELLNAIAEYSKRTENPRLAGFLEEVSLITDIDSWDDRENGVTLMTLHAAKGLEFPVVFISGLEEGLFPLSRNMRSDIEIEEERRLFYVGATRAQEKLYLSWAVQRASGGAIINGQPSRFIGEIDTCFLEHTDGAPKTHASRDRHSAQSRPRSDAYDYEYDDASVFTDDVPQIQILEIGMHVRHASFGDGVVQDVDGYGENMRITVDFDFIGRKRLLAKYAKLEIL
jgi:DNA helicase-2/ATP-dependent DNA helicase PcrA